MRGVSRSSSYRGSASTGRSQRLRSSRQWETWSYDGSMSTCPGAAARPLGPPPRTASSISSRSWFAGSSRRHRSCWPASPTAATSLQVWRGDRPTDSTDCFSAARHLEYGQIRIGSCRHRGRRHRRGSRICRTSSASISRQGSQQTRRRSQADRRPPAEPAPGRRSLPRPAPVARIPTQRRAVVSSSTGPSRSFRVDRPDRRLRAPVPDARPLSGGGFTVLDGAGHYLPFERPASFRATVLEWLARACPSSRFGEVPNTARRTIYRRTSDSTNAKEIEGAYEFEAGRPRLRRARDSLSSGSRTRLQGQRVRAGIRQASHRDRRGVVEVHQRQAVTGAGIDELRRQLGGPDSQVADRPGHCRGLHGHRSPPVGEAQPQAGPPRAAEEGGRIGSAAYEGKGALSAGIHVSVGKYIAYISLNTIGTPPKSAAVIEPLAKAVAARL